jgi:hypothetical protein
VAPTVTQALIASKIRAAITNEVFLNKGALKKDLTRDP